MKKYYSLSLIILLATFSGCQVVEGIFKAGVWTGIIAVVLVLALIIWLFSKFFSGKD